LGHSGKIESFSRPRAGASTCAGLDLLLWLGRHGADLSVVDGKQRSILEYLRKNKDEKRKRADEEMVQFLVDKFSF
jgi:hypothetical protein